MLYPWVNVGCPLCALPVGERRLEPGRSWHWQFRRAPSCPGTSLLSRKAAGMCEAPGSSQLLQSIAVGQAVPLLCSPPDLPKVLFGVLLERMVFRRAVALGLTLTATVRVPPGAAPWQKERRNSELLHLGVALSPGVLFCQAEHG